MSPDQMEPLTRFADTYLPTGWQMDICLARHQSVVRLIDDHGGDALVLDAKPNDPKALAFLLDAVHMHLINRSIARR